MFECTQPTPVLSLLPHHHCSSSSAGTKLLSSHVHGHRSCFLIDAAKAGHRCSVGTCINSTGLPEQSLLTNSIPLSTWRCLAFGVPACLLDAEVHHHCSPQHSCGYDWRCCCILRVSHRTLSLGGGGGRVEGGGEGGLHIQCSYMGWWERLIVLNALLNLDCCPMLRCRLGETAQHHRVYECRVAYDSLHLLSCVSAQCTSNNNSDSFALARKSQLHSWQPSMKCT